MPLPRQVALLPWSDSAALLIDEVGRVTVSDFYNDEQPLQMIHTGIGGRGHPIRLSSAAVFIMVDGADSLIVNVETKEYEAIQTFRSR